MEKEYESMSEELVAGVEAALKERYKNGVVESEIDFLCGAMSAAETLGHWPPPPLWIFSSVRGDSIIEGQSLKDTVDIEIERCDWCNEGVPVSRTLLIGNQEWELKPAWVDEPGELVEHDGDRICDACANHEVSE